MLLEHLEDPLRQRRRGLEIGISALKHCGGARGGDGVGKPLEIVAGEIFAHPLQDMQSCDPQHGFVIRDAEHRKEILG